MERLRDRAKEMLHDEETFVLGGDYNILPADEDVWDPEAVAGDAICRPESRGLFREIQYLGLTEAFRALNPDTVAYSYWDYQRGAWQRNHGLRIDHLLLSPLAADRLVKTGIDRDMRGRKQPSDHVPAWCELDETD